MFIKSFNLKPLMLSVQFRKRYFSFQIIAKSIQTLFLLIKKGKAIKEIFWMLLICFYNWYYVSFWSGKYRFFYTQWKYSICCATKVKRIFLLVGFLPSSETWSLPLTASLKNIIWNFISTFSCSDMSKAFLRSGFQVFPAWVWYCFDYLCIVFI